MCKDWGGGGGGGGGCHALHTIVSVHMKPYFSKTFFFIVLDLLVFFSLVCAGMGVKGGRHTLHATVRVRVKHSFSKTVFFTVLDLLVFLLLHVQGWGETYIAYNSLCACEIPL